MEQYPINPTELAFIETMLQLSIQQINSIIPHADHIHRQRLTYFLIETRRAAYKSLRVKKTMLDVLGISEMHVHRMSKKRGKKH